MEYDWRREFWPHFEGNSMSGSGTGWDFVDLVFKVTSEAFEVRRYRQKPLHINFYLIIYSEYLEYLSASHYFIALGLGHTAQF